LCDLVFDEIIFECCFVGVGYGVWLSRVVGVCFDVGFMGDVVVCCICKVFCVIDVVGGGVGEGDGCCGE
jgi:hypothetical protein